MALPSDFMSQVMATYGKPSAFSRLIFGTGLHAGQRRYVRLAKADTNFLLPGNSWGKALANGTPVLRPTGDWTAIEELKAGDDVVGGNGLPTKVLGVYPQGVRPLWRLHFRDGSVDCDEDHLWSDSRRGRVVRTADAVRWKSRKAALCVPTCVPAVRIGGLPALGRTTLSEAEKRPAAEATCIAVDAVDGLFVTKDFIVTHNTEFIARYLVYLAWFKDGPYRPLNFADWWAQEYKGLVASFTYPIAMESFSRLKSLRENRKEVQALITNMVQDPPSVTFANGSIVDWGSLDGEGKLVEAARRRFIFVDEAGHIPDLSATFENILYPRTMGVGGRVHLLGTPKAHSDPFLLEVFEKGKTPNEEYYSQEGSVFENEFWPKEEQRRVLRNSRYVKGWAPCLQSSCDFSLCWTGDPAPAGGAHHPILSPIGGQVLLGRFVIAGGLLFNRQHIARMFTGVHSVDWHGENHFSTGPWQLKDDPEGRQVWRFTPPEDPVGLKAFKKHQASRLYLSCFDLGGNKMKRKSKRGSDATVGFTIDYTERPWRVVHYHYIEGGEMDWQGKYETMAEVQKAYPSMYLLIDATGTSDSVQEALQDRGLEVEGIQLGGNSNKKLDMLRNLQLCLGLDYGDSKGILRCPPLPGLKQELDHYVLPDDHIEQDRVMTLAMLCHTIAQWDIPFAVGGDVY